MKKTIAIISFILFFSITLFATDDYSLGYMKGFEDAIKGDYETYTAILLEQFAELEAEESVEDLSQKKDFGDWRINYFVDSFGDPTEHAYVSMGRQKGTFSNSATRNSRLDWQLVVDIEDKNISFILWEYGSYMVQGSFSNPDIFYLQIKDETGDIDLYRSTNSSDRIVISDYTKFLSLLRTEPKLKIVIEEYSKYGIPSNYNLGTVDLKGFNAIYTNLVGN
ncbi:MAG: hypothetical protein M0R38_11110 [Bacteroidia bacterium]|nr:hypothetical protein [Bacteroidia bacterium]